MLGIEELNEKQREIVTSTGSVCSIKGRAGTGKTTAMLARIHELKCAGNANKTMLNLCFSKYEIQRNKALYMNLFQEEEQPSFTTMYNFCYNLIKKDCEQKQIPVKKAYKDLTQIVNKIIKEHFGVSMNKDELNKVMRAIALSKTLMNEKELQELKLPYPKVDLVYVKKQYEKEKATKCIYDYEDLLIEALQVLANNPQIKEECLRFITYIHVDDAQNLPLAAHFILRNIMKEETQLHYYYDDQQAWDIRHGAYPQVFAHLHTTYPNRKEIVLEEDLRCDPSIHALANAFYYKEEKVYDKEAAHTYKGFASTKELYEFVMEKACESETSIACIARNGSMLLPLVDLLDQKQVPFQLNVSFDAFFQHPIVKDLMDYLTLFANPKHLPAFQKVAEKLKLNFPLKAYNELAPYVQDPDCTSVYQACIDSNIRAELKTRLRKWIEQLRLAEDLSTRMAIAYAMEKLNYQVYMKENQIKQDPIVLCVLYTMAQRYSEKSQFLKRLQELKECKSYHSRIVLDCAEQLHGEEFDAVYVLDMQDQFFPNNDSELERMYFYRTITRAKKQLLFLFAKKYDSFSLRPSPYLLELYRKEEPKQVVSEEKMTIPKPVTKWKKRSRLKHSTLGFGTIVEIDGDMAKVRFLSGEERMLNLKFCMENNLITNLS